MGCDPGIRDGRRGSRHRRWFCAARRRGAPVLAATAFWPSRNDLDGPLVAGAVLFGIGWGLVGICPGPALVNLAGLSLPIVVFVVAMTVGMLGYELWRTRGAASGAVEVPSVPSRADG